MEQFLSDVALAGRTHQVVQTSLFKQLAPQEKVNKEWTERSLGHPLCFLSPPLTPGFLLCPLSPRFPCCPWQFYSISVHIKMPGLCATLSSRHLRFKSHALALISIWSLRTLTPAAWDSLPHLPKILERLSISSITLFRLDTIQTHEKKVIKSDFRLPIFHRFHMSGNMFSVTMFFRDIAVFRKIRFHC